MLCFNTRASHDALLVLFEATSMDIDHLGSAFVAEPYLFGIDEVPPLILLVMDCVQSLLAQVAEVVGGIRRFRAFIWHHFIHVACA